MESGAKGDPLEKLKGLQINSLDVDDEPEEEIVADEYDDVDEDDDEEDEEQEPVTLGFVEKPKNHWSLLRQLFPSKAGGPPAWLHPVNLPSGRSCLCDICGEPLHFMLQVYAPFMEKDSTFHRTLFVFMCPSMSCLLRDQHEQWKRPPEKPSRSVKVFRCQLPCTNPFYSREPPKYDGTDKPTAPGVALCNWCGTWKGDKVCSSCRRVHYCSQMHQVMHWRSGHKIECQQLNLASHPNSANGGTTSAERQKVASSSLWPEYEIVNEDESEYDMEMSEDNGHAGSLISKTAMDDTMKSLMNGFEGDGDRKSWASFQERIAKAPEQVLRYCRGVGAKALWPMSSGRPTKNDIPNCSYCGGPRCFEFQILPQLLYYFNVKNDVDSLDWSTIVVYTCEGSCETSINYVEEFVWVQYSSQTITVA
ncbi:programmed cell death protein 2-like [Mangifera indica]|uniref:programmed cell death protein 2-like n=1 Tax=Mangifera indica TaxID=29780 RepID=UPI001CFB6E9E|nr:programmed cell death protein 2-like [Mangifera indica]